MMDDGPRWVQTEFPLTVPAVQGDRDARLRSKCPLRRRDSMNGYLVTDTLERVGRNPSSSGMQPILVVVRVPSEQLEQTSRLLRKHRGQDLSF